MIDAIFKNSPIHFKISREFANQCLFHIGSVVRHRGLGVMFCEEAVIAEDGSVAQIIFIGTSNKHGLTR